QGLQPDLTLWLDLPVEIGLQRARKRQAATLDRLERATLDFHQRLHEGFAALANQHPQRIHRLDATQSPDILAAEAWEHLTAWLAKREISPTSRTE
ncbi:MAG: dTMP kinase, partial [Cyanobacteria bacterium J06639_1]